MRATRPRAASASSPPAPAAATVIRLVEANGSARTGWDAAVKAAVRDVRDEAGEPVAVEVTRQWADVTARGLGSYHVAVRVAVREVVKPPPRRRGRAAS